MLRLSTIVLAISACLTLMSCNKWQTSESRMPSLVVQNGTRLKAIASLLQYSSDENNGLYPSTVSAFEVLLQSDYAAKLLEHADEDPSYFRFRSGGRESSEWIYIPPDKPGEKIPQRPLIISPHGIKSGQKRVWLMLDQRLQLWTLIHPSTPAHYE